MEKIKDNISSIAIFLFEIVVGILLLINPVGFTTGIITAIGIALIFIGIIFSVRYFRAEAVEAATGQYLLKGLIALVGGAFCTFKAAWFVLTFPALTVIYGTAILATGLGKIQLTFDMIRRKMQKWFLAAISALVSIICALVIVYNPFGSADVLWVFAGVALIAEAVLDVATLIVSKKENL